MTAARAHAQQGQVDLGWVAYGAGNQFSSSVGSLLHLPAAALAYFGDLDDEGLRIAAATARQAAKLGLPELRPHGVLYRMLLGRGRRQARERTWKWPEDGLRWLGPTLGDEVRERLADGWLAQEWVNLEALEEETAWLSRE